MTARWAGGWRGRFVVLEMGLRLTGGNLARLGSQELSVGAADCSAGRQDGLSHFAGLT
jgi:hypothetical protein